MALIQCQFFSEAIGMMNTATVILPERRPAGHAHPTLYLLHGLSDDHSAWVRRTSIERYVEQLGLAVVMPQVHRSFYSNMVAGYDYWTFLSEELPRVMHAMFPLSDRREDRFVAGLSMGGYGAFKWALSRPEQFAAAASLSGALHMANREVDINVRQIEKDIQLIYGGIEPIAGSENDLLWLLEQRRQDSKLIPALFQCCGTEDFLYKDNLVFRDECLAAGVPLTYVEGPGSHDWSYWDARIRDVLDWLPIRKA